MNSSQDSARSGWVPVPDPTVLTTQQTERLRDEMHRSIASQRELLEARLNAMDKAAELIQENMRRVPSELQEQVHHLRELAEAKLASIELRFHERDARNASEKEASALSLSAAFQAAEKASLAQQSASAMAIGKTEVQMREQIEALQQQIRSSTEATNDKIANLTGRLDRGEAAVAGAMGSRSEQRLDTSHIWGIVGGVIGIVMGLVGVASLLITLSRSPVVPSASYSQQHDWPSAVPTAPGTK